VFDVEYAVKNRSSNASDCSGLSNKLVKSAGPVLWLALSSEINKELFKGAFYSDQTEGILGRHSTVGKEDGGTRNLLIPDCIGVILQSIMANRLNIALMEGQTFSLAQKCNIRGVSGVDENAFLFLGCLFEFMNAAVRGRLVDGQMRILFLDDKREAFDRAQFEVLLHAARVLIRFHDQTDMGRYLSLLLSYLEKIKIVVASDGKAALVGKNGGVPQGGPDSGLLFQVIMEYIRRSINPADRPLISIRGMSSTSKLRVEIDYADDAVRTADSIHEAQNMVNAMFQAMHGVDLTENPQKLRAFGLIYHKGQGVRTFDPKLTVREANGSSRSIKAYGPKDWFKVNGLVVNTRGETKGSAQKAAQRDSAVINRIAASDYPIGAKLEALRAVADKGSEYLSFNGCIPTDLTEKLDTLERKSIRSFLGINLPNAYIRGELKLALRSDRHEILHLSALVKRLCSTDPRVKMFALLIVSEPPLDLDSLTQTPTGPAFFDWDKIPSTDPGDHLLYRGARWAWLAAKWGLGLRIVDRKLEITHWRDGQSHLVSDANNVLSMLSKKSEKSWLDQLEKRVSTVSKERPPEFSISWGDSGRKSSDRNDEAGFLKISSFSDREIRILTSLRLLLWPTLFRSSLISGAHTEGRCKCGSIQTATHLLEVPKEAIDHSAELRQVPGARHTAWVSCLVDWCEGLGGGWKILQAEGHDGDPDFEATRCELKQAVALGTLRRGPDGRQHYKPDVVIARRLLTGLEVRVLDVCAGSPDKLCWESEIRNELSKVKLASTVLFSFEGALTPQGLEHLKEESKEKAARITQFKSIRYQHRYQDWADTLQSLDHSKNAEVTIHAVALGVTGYIPPMTSHALLDFTDEKSVRKLMRALRMESWKHAILAYDAWRKEFV
jgi:hypothetical protein